jgi:hypothetical protein
MSSIGLSIAIAIVMLGIHRLVYNFNKYFANAIILFFLMSIFSATYLISRGINIDKNKYDYLGYLQMGKLTRKYITTIEKLCPKFPEHSLVYLVNFKPILRIHTGVKLFYNDKTLKVISLSEEEFKKINLTRDGSVFVFKVSERGEISDLTSQFR